MNSEYVTKVCVRHFHKEPDSVERFAAGLGNYVFRVRFQEESYVFRCGEQSYMETINWLCRLKQEEIPISQVIDAGVVDGVNYMICTFLEGEELGTVYPMLSDQDKRHIANTVVDIQERAARLNIPPKRSVWEWVQHMLDRAQARIAENGYFEAEKVERLREAADELRVYFDTLIPVTYLDDISTKNLLIFNGRVSGVIDVDWVGVGDRLTFVALTEMALRNLQYDVKYPEYLLERLQITEEQRRAYQFYVLLYCVDFMGERGTTFNGRTVPVSSEIVGRLNSIYEELWKEL